jgi:hypothetical protein
MHPEDTLTQTQALILVGIVISAISAMVEGIKAHAPAVAAQAASVPPP